MGMGVLVDVSGVVVLAVRLGGDGDDDGGHLGDLDDLGGGIDRSGPGTVVLGLGGGDVGSRNLSVLQAGLVLLLLGHVRLVRLRERRLGGWGAIGAEEESDIGLTLETAERSPVVMGVVVSLMASIVAREAGDGRAARGGLEEHAGLGERALGTVAVDIGDVVPGHAIPGVLELSDGAVEIIGLGELERDTAADQLPHDLTVGGARADLVGHLRVTGHSSIDGIGGIDRPEVDIVLAEVLDDGLVASDGRGGEESCRSSGNVDSTHDESSGRVVERRGV